MSEARSSLADEIRTLIAQEGPISVERYMALALGHPTLGYYMTRDPFGSAGDFITAPEISQMFGELLGLWAATVWGRMDGPKAFRLIELGPGRGTLMADALRAARALPPFRAAIDVHLVETSPALRAAQRQNLEPLGVAVTWHSSIDTIPAGPAIVLANEFFDALPVRHFVCTPQGWCERLVGLRDEALVFGTAPHPEPSLTLDAPVGTMFEIGLMARRIAGALAARLVRDGGAALAVDYGYTSPRLGETLQAVKGHRSVDPLAEPGQADLTTHVDFAALSRGVQAAGALVHGSVLQGEFLQALGIGPRAETLKKQASAVQAEAIDAAVARLTEEGAPDRPGMGRLFQVLAFSSPGLAMLPGFPPGAGANL